MQGYLKFKEKDEELYEIDRTEISSNNWFAHTYLRFVVKVKKWFDMLTVKEIYSGLIFILPILSNEKKRQKHLKKCISKIKKLMKKYQISQMVLAEELQQDETFMEGFQNNRKVERKVHILDGKKLITYLIKEIVEYISNKQGRTLELEDVHVLVKQDNLQYRENITFLASYFKTLNIVTPSLKNYQKLAKQLEEKQDIILTVTNNRKKSLKRAKWVINFDLSAEEIKKYTINRMATIIYLTKEGIYEESGFEGLHICKAGIDVSQEVKDFFEKQNLLNQCPITVLYESTIQCQKSFKQVKEQMRKDQVKIEKLYGRRGLLSEKEYQERKDIY
ncbi:MAG: hypothetical protein HFJ29_03420 [Clostridia bacterium]|nr:hypothetical protein [Clostridia bacterium]